MLRKLSLVLATVMLPPALMLVCVTAHAQAQSALEAARAELGEGRFEAAIRRLEDAEEEESGQSRVEARLMLGQAYGELGERDEQRHYLSLVLDADAATAAQIALAETMLTAARPPASAEYADPFQEPLVQLALSFAALEVALLIAGGIVMAETGCVNDPVPCDLTGRTVGIGLLIGGSVWWIVPAVLATVVGLTISVLPIPNRSSLSGPPDLTLHRF